MSALYLSRLTLNPLRGDVQRDLANCHAMHQRILSAFHNCPDVEQARKSFGVLYRIEQSRGNDSGAIVVLTQSQSAPDWSRLPSNYLAHAVVKNVAASYDAIGSGAILIFRLRANPTRRISRGNRQQAERWLGKRVELRREEDQIAWLQRKGDAAGFQVVTVRTKANVADARVAARSVMTGFRPQTGKMTFGDILFEGRLRVTDAIAFNRTLADGIGSGKAYGFGLLSVALASNTA